ncbi:MAG: hypothetical protein AAFP02_08215 [Bacteroidota bacterium]
MNTHLIVTNTKPSNPPSVFMHISKRSFSQNFRPTIGFVLRPTDSEEIYRVELAPFQMAQTIIRVLNSTGELILESQSIEELQASLEYTVQDVQAGIYYFEVNDGFYYQIKEVRVPAA